MDIVIRKVKPEDLERVTAVEAECFPEAEAAGRDAFRARIEAFPDSFLVAEKDGQLVGFINGCVTDERTIRDEMYEDSSLHRPDGRYQSVFGLDVIPKEGNCRASDENSDRRRQKKRKGGNDPYMQGQADSLL